MTLPFSTHWGKDMPIHLAGKPTYFVEKIWQCLLRDSVEMDCLELGTKLKEVMPMIGNAEIGGYPQKKHTIRMDSKDRWEAEKLIHPVIHNRTPKRYQFAPVLKCLSAQSISIEHSADHLEVYIDGVFFGSVFHHGLDHIYEYSNCLEVLAINDGFNSIHDFFLWFKEDFDGKIIHWTELRY